jgi:ParB-like chromosome segregation protein Spo0J
VKKMLRKKQTEAKRFEASPRVAINYRSIDELKMDPNNPRIHTPRQVDRIANSIQEFGFIVPALVDASNKVIAGHGRLLACRKLGWREGRLSVWII